MVVLFKYLWYSWSPPVQTRQEQISTGEQIARFGKEHFRREFRRKTQEHSLSPEQQATREAVQKWPQWQRIALLTVGIATCLAACFSMPFLIPIVILILIIALGSWLALFRFNRWLARCLKAYDGEKLNSKTFSHIVACSGCGQSLRIPSGRGKLRIRCPYCSNEFFYES